MARHIAWVVAVLLFAAGPASAAGRDASCDRDQAPKQQGGAHPPAPASAKPDNPGEKRPERPKWWIDTKLRAELGITDQQSAAVETVWQKSAPLLRELREKLTKLEDALSKLTDGADEAAVIAQSERVESVRAELNRGRTLMIYRMNNILRADQRAKVKAMYDHNDQGRRGPSSDKSDK